MSLGVAFGVSKSQAKPSVFLCLLPADPDIELSASLQYHVCLDSAMATRHDDTELNL